MIRGYYALILEAYFVDCENVGYACINCVKETSRVFYFTSDIYKIKSNIEPHERIVQVETNQVKNGLDFIIDAELGYYIRCYGKKCNYYIVSKDKGFDIVIDFYKSRSYKIERISAIAEVADVDITIVANNVVKIENVYKHWLRSKSRNRFDLIRNLSNCKPCRNLGTSYIAKLADDLIENGGKLDVKYGRFIIH